FRRSNVVSASGILEYSYKDLQKATYNFTTLIGQGAFGPVYKAQMSTGETVAVKVLATDSKQGEKEFQTEVAMVNSENHEPLSWNLRVYIALDVARGLEYLHDGVIFLLIRTIDGPVCVCRHAVPPVIHRDIKSSNILLDQSMRARVADFGLSREEMVDKHAANIRGTFGYLDPEYISTRTFTKKSDVYSFGVLLFELIAGRNPLQGLMEYVELAAMSTEEKDGWEEIADSRLDGKFDVQELNEVAALAYKCVNRVPKKRPSMRDIVQVLTRILKTRHIKKHQMSLSVATAGEVPVDLEQGETKIPITVHQRDESMDSATDTFE
ncbi:hypothetical protein Gotri_001288, partial [Gossypium trilobum]|nr:hypothetical protein [Gossypium trilobum]